MVVISCSKEGCDWKTVDRDEALAAVLAAELSNHTVVAHAPNSEKDPDANVKKSPAIDRPKEILSLSEIWDSSGLLRQIVNFSRPGVMKLLSD